MFALKAKRLTKVFGEGALRLRTFFSRYELFLPRLHIFVVDINMRVCSGCTLSWTTVICQKSSFQPKYEIIYCCGR